MLPDLDAASYAALSGGTPEVPPLPGLPAVLVGCARCHDNPTGPPASSWIPRLGAQPAAYLLRSLREFADGTRASGIMQAAIIFDSVPYQTKDHQVADVACDLV